ncbi:MAG: SLC13 family permease, partial [Serratia proteamaculans]
VLVLGVGYMLVARRWLANDDGDKTRETWQRRTFRDLIRDYKLTGRARRLALRSGSPLVGHSLDELHLRARYGANVVGIERWKRFRRVMVSASGSTELREGDVLLLDMSDSQVDLREFCSEQQLEPMVLRGDYFSEQSRNVGMAEVSLIPDSTLLGKSLRESAFRSRYDLNVVGIRRNGETLAGKLVDEPLALGDILLVIGDWKAIRQLQAKTHDFIVLNLPAEVDEVAPAITQAPHALFCLALMVAMMLTDEIPNPIAALIACLLMGKFRCIDMESAYKSIHWPSIILIVGMMPFAQALQKTGGVDLIVRGLMDVAGDAGPRVMLVCLFALCATIGLFISNTATAVLMAPIAIAAAREMGVSPYPFAMIIAIAASAAFMTPVSSPVNTLVLGPGNYKFGDFIRMGVPFTLLVMVVSVIIVPWLYAF